MTPSTSFLVICVQHEYTCAFLTFPGLYLLPSLSLPSSPSSPNVMALVSHLHSLLYPHHPAPYTICLPNLRCALCINSQSLHKTQNYVRTRITPNTRNTTIQVPPELIPVPIMWLSHTPPDHCAFLPTTPLAHLLTNTCPPSDPYAVFVLYCTNSWDIRFNDDDETTNDSHDDAYDKPNRFVQRCICANTKAIKLTNTTQIYQSSCTRSHNCMSSTSYVPYAHMYTHIYICFQTEFRLSVYIVLFHKIGAKLALGPVMA